ncbi:tyrosine-type recombinase/integrase [Arthrobacter sp. YN]|uniref:tyrosine-type recombinase/integrase n=1 Tax=Arthrobacter sp. YN TaxID=2020486 RepID=UPI000B5FFF1B|nr:site-specific integrase [Arthrobacter sp. YN]ASN20656.1 site-specific integrase [Arthrobacter sp. YN]
MSRIDDRWVRKDKTRTPLYGKGKRWQAVWYENGKEKKASFAFKDAAQAHLTSIDHRQRSGTYTSRELGRVHVGELLDPWMDTLLHLRDSTVAATRSDVRATIRPYWENRIVADITRADIQEWVSGMKKAARTVETIYGRFRNFLNWCVEEGRIPHSPAVGVNLPRGHKREHIYLKVSEVSKLALSIDPFYTDLVWFLAMTGLRFGEAAELRAKDLHLERGRITVARSVTDVDGKMVVGPPKNGKPRDVPVPGYVMERVTRRAASLARDDLVFPGPRGGWLRSNNFKRRTYNPAVKAAKLPADLWVHDLRHTAASLAISSGASVKSVQRMLGHASAKITLDVYAGLFDQDLDDVSLRMNALILDHELPRISAVPA